MKTNVYIDGFNLFYGLLKKSPNKWLNLEALFDALLPQNEVACIRYFTARVEARDHDMDLPVRQETYLRALATLPRVKVEFGNFMASAVKAPLVSIDPITGRAQRGLDGRPVLQRTPEGQLEMACVYKSEEKGSDVNLAAHLLRDAFLGACECAVVVSNDSDLLTPIRMAKVDCGLTIGLIPPRPKGSVELKRLADFQKTVRVHNLEGAQFEQELTDTVGTFRRPAGW